MGSVFIKRLLVRFSQLITEQRWINELDLNPLMASPEKLLMLQERVMHERLARICHCDYDREIALLAETTNVGGEQDLMGEVRLSILIGDPYQGIGLGSEIVHWAVEVAPGRGP